jgi:hypothetical protein
VDSGDVVSAGLLDPPSTDFEAVASCESLPQAIISPVATSSAASPVALDPIARIAASRPLLPPSPFTSISSGRRG